MANKKGAGRKSNYFSKVEPYFDEIKSWRYEGQTEENISKLLGVSYRSFMEYKVKYPQLSQVLRESTKKLLSELESTMYEMALGKVKVKKVKNTYVRDSRTGKMILDKKEENEDTLAPNTTMLIFSLKNLDPDKWRDRRDLNLGSESTVDVALENFQLVSEELKKSLRENKDEKSDTEEE